MIQILADISVLVTGFSDCARMMQSSNEYSYILGHEFPQTHTFHVATYRFMFREQFFFFRDFISSSGMDQEINRFGNARACHLHLPG